MPLIRLSILFLALVSTIVGARADEPTASFLAAKPVWPAGRETERNLFVEFRAAFDQPTASAVTLRVAGATLYRAYVNGQFAGHGPARAGHGLYRVDEWDIAPLIKPGRNEIVIEIAGYNANSYYLLDQPSFLQAEVVAGEKVVAATSGGDFVAAIRHDRVQKVQRYSFQRPFSEIWRLPGSPAENVRTEVVAPKPLADRGVPYPAFKVRPSVAHIAKGEVRVGDMPTEIWKDRSLTGVGPQLAGFPEAELATIPSIELQRVTNLSSEPASATNGFTLKQNTYRILDFGGDLTGFIGAKITARTKTRLFVTFDEILTGNDVDFKRLGCVNAILYELEPGDYTVESLEPYTVRYVKFTVLAGECDVSDCHLRELVNPEADRASFNCSDDRFNRIFEAARQTLRQNAVDIFTDCPSRERAGWLCDSFFTARVAADLCGDTRVEKNFLENFQRPEKFAFLPDGMLPMCYPADHNDGVFIPNWSMWFVLELEEYAARSGDSNLVAALRPRVLKLLDYFKQYENSDGLLEKLPGWVFVEWSAANDFVQDVNYPTCMLYAATLDAAGRLYHLPELTAKAARLREVIRQQSYDGEFFVDNAVRRDGKLQVTTNRTEVCQYFAFYFGLASPASHSTLWKKLATDFGPQRKQTKAYPEIHPANAFIGNMLRFELLARDGRSQQILDEAIGYWLYMADRTGTLWEMDSPSASCNHGFASHAAHVFFRDVLGLQHVDTVGKTIQVRLNDIKLDWCKGVLPTPQGTVELAWRKTGNQLAYHLLTPTGYQVEIQNSTGRTLVKE